MLAALSETWFVERCFRWRARLSINDDNIKWLAISLVARHLTRTGIFITDIQEPSTNTWNRGNFSTLPTQQQQPWLREIINVVNAELMIRTWDYGCIKSIARALKHHQHRCSTKIKQKFFPPFAFLGSPFVCSVRWNNEQVMDFLAPPALCSCVCRMFCGHGEGCGISISHRLLCQLFTYANII